MTTIKYAQFAYIMLCKDHSSYDLKDERVRENRKEILETVQTNKNAFAESREAKGRAFHSLISSFIDFFHSILNNYL